MRQGNGSERNNDIVPRREEEKDPNGRDGEVSVEEAKNKAGNGESERDR